MPFKRIEVYYTDAKNTKHLVFTTNKSPTIKHAIELYKKYIDEQSTYTDECKFVGEQMRLSNLSGEVKEWNSKEWSHKYYVKKVKEK